MKVFTSVKDAVDTVGQELGVGDWKVIEQKRIDDFADVTEDHQWIHIDTDRAKTDSPYGATIAHGFLSLSLLPKLSKDNYRVDGKMGVNYGLNKVRFLAPVRAGSRIRVRSALIAADPVGEDTVNLTLRHTIEVEGSEKPAAVADLIARYTF